MMSPVEMFRSWNDLFMILANSADPDEMRTYAAFHLGLHYLLKFPFTGILNERVSALDIGFIK